ncbi:helix-turn-helix domain-containing protein [Levilactobacillus sp. HBUAS70063]|uniref:helix-turn-helix domain-containing protein n=1 Tax=Levilactobacillus sp. HBUAS70063 TaxID=3109359 RepID=UPI003132B4E3
MRTTIDIVLDYLQRLLHTPIFIYDHEKLARCLSQQTIDKSMESEQSKLVRLVAKSISQYPKLCEWPDGRSLALIRKENIVYILGPILIAESNSAENHSQLCSMDTWLEGLCLLQNVLTGGDLRPSDLYAKNNLSCDKLKDNAIRIAKLFNQNQENTFIHNPYDQELRELNSVTTGDIAGLKASLHENFEGDFARLGPTRLRSFKNLGIVDLALLARAAIRGGVDPEQSFTINDQYINSVEMAQTIQEITALGLRAKMAYTQMVHDVRTGKIEGSNRIVRRCQLYVQTHLHEKITLRLVSAHCQVTPQYLSRLFLKNQRLRFSEYVQREKINASKRDLVYTQQAISAIAFNYGYSTASHYASVFKRYAGMTPNVFRNRNGKI